MQQSVGKVVAGINKDYTMEIGKKKRRFNNNKTFLKAFPKEQRESIGQYLEQNKIDFNNVRQVFEMYKQVAEAFSYQK